MRAMHGKGEGAGGMCASPAQSAAIRAKNKFWGALAMARLFYTALCPILGNVNKSLLRKMPPAAMYMPAMYALYILASPVLPSTTKGDLSS